MMIVPASRKENCKPMMVTTGMRAFGTACFHRAPARERPLARAVRMKSSPSISMTAERVTRPRMAASGRPSAKAGRMSECRPLQIPSCQPEKPEAGNQASFSAKSRMKRSASQKFGMATPTWAMPMTTVSPALPRLAAA
ncbi:hypothetical protein D3C87_1621270 [compost metagenome]